MAKDPRRCCYLSLASPAGHVASLPAGFQLDGHEPVALHQQHIPVQLGSMQKVSGRCVPGSGLCCVLPFGGLTTADAAPCYFSGEARAHASGVLQPRKEEKGKHQTPETGGSVHIAVKF